MLTLVLLCFFFSMLITNDVALITFVPFTFIVLRMLGTRLENRLLLPVVMLQTIGANLGSMLTPIGNPQNLYLLWQGRTVGWRIPSAYAAVHALVIGDAGDFQHGSGQRVSAACENGKDICPEGFPGWEKCCLSACNLSWAVFALPACRRAYIALAGVFFAALIIIFVTDRRILTKVDYSLLFTIQPL
ncbi:MAG: hypothetical protein HFJ01_16190 [Lachnospiraceae bacterium]|nr:hypothetical protein [Lachnospiraceae bacterium]